jgi:hypothetical protein
MRARLALSAMLAAASLAAASCSGGTYVTVTLEASGAALSNVARIDLDLQLAGKNASATLTGKGGNVTFPTTTVLEVASGDGAMMITANAIDAGGNIVAQTMGTAMVQKGKSTTATLAFGGGGGGGGGGPDLAGGPCSICDPKATCSVTGDTATCSCPAGFTGDGKTCTDVDECAGGTAMCDTNATCTNIPGSFTCSCKAGYQGTGFMCTQIFVTAKTIAGFFLTRGGPAVGLGNRIYFGNTGTASTQQFKSWDVTTGSAGAVDVEGQNINLGESSHLLAAGTTLYFFAFSGSSYNTTTKAWSSVAAYTGRERSYGGTALLGSTIYWIGDYQTMTTAVQTFDTVGGGFGTATGYPIAIGYNHAQTVGGKIYSLGGETVGNQSTSAMYVYDPSGAGTWTQKANAPTGNALYSIATATYKNQLWVIVNTTLSHYDPQNDLWLPSLALPPGGANWQIAVTNPGMTGEALYVLGDFPTGMSIYKYNLP